LFKWRPHHHLFNININSSSVGLIVAAPPFFKPSTKPPAPPKGWLLSISSCNRAGDQGTQQQEGASLRRASFLSSDAKFLPKTFLSLFPSDVSQRRRELADLSSPLFNAAMTRENTNRCNWAIGASEAVGNKRKKGGGKMG
jgi:hypothetical protein